MGVGELPSWYLGCRDTRIPRIQLASAEAKLTTNHHTSASRTQILLFSYSFRLQKAVPLGAFSVTHKMAKLSSVV